MNAKEKWGRLPAKAGGWMRAGPIDRKRNAKHPAKVLTLAADVAAGLFRRDLLRSAPGPPGRGGSARAARIR